MPWVEVLINSIRWRPNTVKESGRLLSFVSIVYLAAGPCILTLCVYMDTFLCVRELFLCVKVGVSIELCYCAGREIMQESPLSIWESTITQ